jgi:hypothetical protein
MNEVKNDLARTSGGEDAGLGGVVLDWQQEQSEYRKNVDKLQTETALQSMRSALCKGQQMSRVESLNKAAELDAISREWCYQSLFQDDVTGRKMRARALALSARASIYRRVHA